MQAQCEINLTEEDVSIEIQGREKLSVLIDEVEQDMKQNICELKKFIDFLSTKNNFSNFCISICSFFQT